MYIYYKIEIFGDGGIFILEEIAGDGAVGEGVLLGHYLLRMGGRLVGLKFFSWNGKGSVQRKEEEAVLI